MIKGKDAGKRGKVLSLDPVRNRVTVEGINIFKKHKKPRPQKHEKGEIILVPRPVHRSNVALYCSACKRGVRSGIRMEGERKARYCKQCGGTI